MKPTSATRSSVTDPARPIRAELARLGAKRSPVDPAAVRPMKPETADRPFSRAGWVFELKYDGFRMLSAGGAGEARLFYKSGHEATRIFPELAQAVAGLPFRGLLLDGEAVVLDDRGHPHFQRLQRRGLRVRLADVQHAAAAHPATLFLFDLLAFEDFDLRPLPLAARKAILRRVIPPGDGWLRLSEEIPERGEDLYAAVSEMGLEGMVAKRADSPYRSGYQSDWLKVRVDQSSDFAVIGLEPHGSGLRRLHLAVREGGGLHYAGTVGTGFGREMETEIRARLDPLRRDKPPVPAPLEKGTVWVEPELVVEVRYKEWTEGGHLRHPVFLRLRDDKTVDECFRPGEERRRSPCRKTTPRPPRKHRARGNLSNSPTSTRFSGPTRGSPREIWSTTTARSPHGCCRSCATVLWCSTATRTASTENPSFRRTRRRTLPATCARCLCGRRARDGRSTTCSATTWTPCSTW